MTTLEQKIIDHKFRNQCYGACESCEEDPKNMCSVPNEDFSTCFKTRAEHSESYHDEKILIP